MPRHVVVLFDIDDTLIDFDLSSGADKVTWNGGDPENWKRHLRHLKDACKEIDVEAHYGFATFKPYPGDWISGEVSKTFAEFLHPKLHYFTDKKSKTRYGLDLAKEKLEEEYSVSIAKSDMWIIDDDPKVADDAQKNKYQAIEANFIAQYSKKHIEEINNLFQPIYKHLGLKPPIVESSLGTEEKRQVTKLKNSDSFLLFKSTAEPTQQYPMSEKRTEISRAEYSEKPHP